MFFRNPTFSYIFSMCQTCSYDFWIMNAMYTFMHLFVMYFSFAPVISSSIHRYVNYFDIQVRMMVTETETLTSTLHHNIFTYLDYVIFCYLHIYIYIVIHRQTVSFYQNSSVWLDTLETHPTLRQTKSQTARPTSGPRWLREFLGIHVPTAAASVCFHVYALSATRVFNSFEELWIVRAAADNSFVRVFNPHGGAFCQELDIKVIQTSILGL